MLYGEKIRPVAIFHVIQNLLTFLKIKLYKFIRKAIFTKESQGPPLVFLPEEDKYFTYIAISHSPYFTCMAMTREKPMLAPSIFRYLGSQSQPGMPKVSSKCVHP